MDNLSQWLLATAGSAVSGDLLNAIQEDLSGRGEAPGAVAPPATEVEKPSAEGGELPAGGAGGADGAIEWLLTTAGGAVGSDLLRVLKEEIRAAGARGA